MVKLTGRPTNRVITVVTDNLHDLDNVTSVLLDIIDSWGGTNPYPRFIIHGSDIFYYYYSCTTKIPTINLEEFDKELSEWRIKYKQ